MGIRAKMRLNSVIAQQWGGAQAIFNCEYDTTIPEDQKFQKATPSGMAQFSIDNPAAISQLVIGKTYYFDISDTDPAPAANPAAAGSASADVPQAATGAADSVEGSNATQG